MNADLMMRQVISPRLAMRILENNCFRGGMDPVWSLPTADLSCDSNMFQNSEGSPRIVMPPSRSPSAPARARTREHSLSPKSRLGGGPAQR